MTRPDQDQYVAAVRSVLMRWCIVLAAVGVFAVWAMWRMNSAAFELSSVNLSTAAVATVEPQVEYWTCTMHPDIRQADAGNCPKCGMELVPKYIGSDTPNVKPFGATHVQKQFGAAAQPKAWYRCTMPECNDPGSDDPKSRCPVCGMKREAVVIESGAGNLEEAEIALGPRARRLAELATEPVARRLLWKRVRTVGKVTYDETRYKMVSAWTSGRIDTLFADFTGMMVSEGDHLVEIYSPELVSAQEEVLQALRTVEAMNSNSPEMSRVRAKEVLLSAQHKLELLGITSSQIEELKQTRKAASHLVVYAPLGGTIVHKWAMEGKYVKTGDPLYEIADLTYVWLLLDLYEADLPWIMPFQDVKVTAASLPGEEFRGQIVFVDPVVDKTTRTIKVRVNVGNPKRRLKPEMFVTAEIDAAVGEGGLVATPEIGGAFACPMHPWERADTLEACVICGMDMVPADAIPGRATPRAVAPVLSVPREAVMRTGERSLVYIATSEGVYRGAELVVGPVAQGERGRQFHPVLRGLTEGQMVVTRGTFVIDSQMQIAGKPSLFNARGLGAMPAHDHGGTHGPASSGEQGSGPGHDHDDALNPVQDQGRRDD